MHAFGLRHDDRYAGVAAFDNRGVERDRAKERTAEHVGRALTAALLEDVDLFVAMRTAEAGTLVLAERVEQGGGPSRLTREPDGLAHFPHVQAIFEERFRDRVVAALDAPLHEPVFEAVDLVDPPEEPIVLELPSTGSLGVTLVDADGQPYVPIDDELYALTQTWKAGDGRTRERYLHLPGGALHLAHVGTGLTLRLTIDSEECGGFLQFAGPSQPGEHVQVEVPVEAHPRIGGRLVDAEGAPLAGYWFATHLSQRPGYQNQYFETEEDGRFAIGVPTLFGATDRSGHVVIFRASGDAHPGQARYDLDQLDLQPGHNELGDVVLQEQPVVVEGEVVDDRGAPVPGAAIIVWQTSGDSRWGAATLDDGSTLTDEEGHFEMRGHVAGEELLMHADKDGHRGALTSFRAGQRGLRYVLSRAGALEANVRLDEETSPRQLVVRLTNQSDGVTLGQVGSRVIREGVLRWPDLEAGTYDFELRAVGAPDPLVSWPSISVPPGETTRLEEIDLRDRLRHLRLSFRNTAGEPVLNASVLVDPDGALDRPRAALTTSVGEVEVVSANESVDVLVLAPGYRSTRRNGLREDTQIELEPGLAIELRLSIEGGESPLLPGQQLMPLLRRYDAQDPDPQPWQAGHRLYLGSGGALYYPSLHPWLWRQEVPLDEDGRVTLAVPAAGSYAVEWRVGSSPYDARDLELPPATFAVREASQVQVVELRLDAGRLQQALSAD